MPSTLLQADNRIDETMLMLDEDDDFLCDIPDEMFNHPESTNQNVSPVLDDSMDENHKEITPRDQRSNHQTAIGQRSPCSSSTLDYSKVHRKPEGLSRPKLFPSLENVHIENEQSLRKTDSSTRLSSVSSVESVADRPLNRSFTSTPNNELKHTTQHQSFKSPAISSYHNDKSGPCTNKYPLILKVNPKIENIYKIRIRDGEWICNASVEIERQKVDVSFSNEVRNNNIYYLFKDTYDINGNFVLSFSSSY